VVLNKKIFKDFQSSAMAGILDVGQGQWAKFSMRIIQVWYNLA
jgi:hypothetical protein